MDQARALMPQWIYLLRLDRPRAAREVILKRELDALVTQMHSSGVSYTEAIRQFKRRYLIEVLAKHRGNQCKAAEELGMHRNTLSRTLAELDLDSAQIRSGARRPPMREQPREQTRDQSPPMPRIVNAR